MSTLNRKVANKPVQHPERILQFGGGNFLRAFCDWMFHVLNQETDFSSSVIVVKPTERGDYVELREQDGLFNVALDGIREGELHSEVTLVESVSRVIQPYKQWDEYLKSAEQPGIRFVVSNTTEAGIKFNAEDKLEDQPAKEFPAKLTQWLYHRYQFFNGAADKGLILLPVELIEDNGDALRKTILEYAAAWNLDTDFATWIKESNYFCSTLVDRIVSGYPKNRAEAIQTDLGVEDKLLVAGEWYHSWVIKAPAEAKAELPFDKTDLNVQFVEELGPYREMKVRVLNGAHTSLVPVGYLAGIRTVIESMRNETVVNHIDTVLTEEVKPTLVDFSSEEIDAFSKAVTDRFKNPTLQHFLIDIALNSTSKFKARLQPAFLDYYKANGSFAKRIAFSLACLIRFYKGEFGGEAINVRDDQEVLDFFKAEWSKVDGGKQDLEALVTNVLTSETVFAGAMNAVEGLPAYLVAQIKSIDSIGVIESLKQL